jgi:dipeptidyl aminopeptidase/acylaminoacyl peptidase
MRQDIEFKSKGLLYRGWLYVPENLSDDEMAPGIVMAHGMVDSKEMGLDGFDNRFEANGFATRVFDYRLWGESEDEPRNQMFTLEMVEDYHNAITWISERSEVDSQRISIWGTSYSGGFYLYVSTHDQRVKAVVAQGMHTIGTSNTVNLRLLGKIKSP